jgi:hypothetical protein
MAGWRSNIAVYPGEITPGGDKFTQLMDASNTMAANWGSVLVTQFPNFPDAPTDGSISDCTAVVPSLDMNYHWISRRLVYWRSGARLYLYAKSGGYNWFAPTMYYDPTTFSFAYFDSVGKTVGTTANVSATGIADAGNGWVRCYIEPDLSVFDPYGKGVFYFIFLSDGDGGSWFAGDGVQGTLFGGAQIVCPNGAATYVDTGVNEYVAESRDVAYTPVFA